MGNPIREFALHLRRLLTAPGEELTLWQRGLAFAARLASHCAGELRRDKASQIAAALTYHTLFSLVPMLVLGFLVVGSLRGLETYSDRFETFVLDLLLPQALLDSSAFRTVQGGPGYEEFESAREALRGRFADVLDQLSSVSFTGISIVGVIAFFYGATSLLSIIERSFDSIYRAERKRSLRVRLPLYFTLIVLGPIVVVGSQILQDQWTERISSSGNSPWLGVALVSLSPLLASWVVLLIAFRGLPNTYVQLRAAAIGSFIGASLWLVLQELFGVYVQSTAITSLYGALALIPLLLLWIFLSWLIVLFGLEISYSVQYVASNKFGADPMDPPVPGDPRWFVPMVTSIAAAFRQGQTRSRPEIAAEMGLSMKVITPFLERLQEAGVILEIEGSSDSPPHFALARPPETIYIRDVLQLADPPRHEEGPAWQALAELESKTVEELGDKTIEDLITGATGC